MTGLNRTSTRRAMVRGTVVLAGAAAVAPRVIRAADPWDPVRAAVASANLANGAALLVATPGETLFREAFGPTLIQIPVLLASASMGPSALAILALVDQGLFGLDDRLSIFIPKFDGESKGVTIRQCLAHTSGIADPGDLLTPPEKDPGVSLEEEVDRAARKKPLAKPGDRFLLGGMSYQAAGRAAEVAGGTAWELLFKQSIDDPLGVSFTFGETPDPRLAAGASGSVDAFGAVLQAILNDGELNGVRVLSKTLVKELRTNQIGQAAKATPVTAGVKEQGYGLGWWLEEMDDRGVAKRINAAGSFGTVPWIDFEKGYAAVLMMNATQKDGEDLAALIRPMIEANLG